MHKFTWFNANLSIGSCLDKFLSSKDLVQSVDRCDITPCPLSDHNFVSFVFDNLLKRIAFTLPAKNTRSFAGSALN